MTESTNDRRQKLNGLRYRISSAGSKNDLIDAIDDALGVSGPVGEPKVIEALGRRYTGRTDEADAVSDRIDKIARKGLPQVWVGDTRPASRPRRSRPAPSSTRCTRSNSPAAPAAPTTTPTTSASACTTSSSG
ncbi:hypothetical protein [Streptomyces sp. NPDC058695]|uniref:hypothetical protein n=1 Tax=Streptomyces sp. NPDC058695 TaxID=3346604 RepID=UPI00364FB0E1